MRLGYIAVRWPEFGWVAAALTLIALMSVQGFALLLPTHVRVCLELQKDKPDFAKAGRLLRFYVLMTAMQSTMQVIVVMARFVTGV